MGKASRDKGRRGEIEAVKRLSELFDGLFVRTPGSGSFKEQGLNGDIRMLDHGDLLHIEVKRTENSSPLAWLRQAEGDARPGHIPVVLWRPNREDWVVILRLSVLPSLVGLLRRYLRKEVLHPDRAARTGGTSSTSLKSDLHPDQLTVDDYQ